ACLVAWTRVRNRPGLRHHAGPVSSAISLLGHLSVTFALKGRFSQMTLRPLLPAPALFSLLFPVSAFAPDPTPRPADHSPPAPPPRRPGPAHQPPPPPGAGLVPPPQQVLGEEAAASNDNSALAKDGHPMAGFHNGLFYLRDYNDNFRLHIQGRAHLDFYTYAGP